MATLFVVTFLQGGNPAWWGEAAQQDPPVEYYASNTLAVSPDNTVAICSITGTADQMAAIEGFQSVQVIGYKGSEVAPQTPNNAIASLVEANPEVQTDVSVQAIPMPTPPIGPGPIKPGPTIPVEDAWQQAAALIGCDNPDLQAGMPDPEETPGQQLPGSGLDSAEGFQGGKADGVAEVFMVGNFKTTF